ncbi:MAG TPA: branched-chain amino acid ABC transporter substrate-binding protein [Terracidiphilus sp.]
MIGGAAWSWWIGFHIAVVVLLVADTFLPLHGDDRRSHILSWIWTGCLVLMAMGFAGWIAMKEGHATALQFVAGYTIEMSLSVDNLFVFLVIFQGFHVRTEQQHKALAWGVGGAIVLRAIFIALGVTLIHRFEWITYVFGAMLLWAGWRLMSQSSTHDVLPRFLRRMHPAEGSLLPVILAVEATDVMFALDSIPAVLAVSRDPFVVYTSNIAAILGLRSLYFAISSLLDRLRYLHYGLGALLGFVGLKMILAPWFDISIVASLGVIGGILTVCAIASVIANKVENKRRQRDAGQESSQ